MRRMGLRDPRTDKRPFAVIQLRQEDLAGASYNLVGFQTNLMEAEQRRVFRMIPGLVGAEFLRFGQMHRNTYLNAPRVLAPTLQFHARPDLFAAGQLAGIEGYMGNIASGWLAAWNLARVLAGKPPSVPPSDSMLGSMCHYLATTKEHHFAPVKANFGIVPPLSEPPRGKFERYAAYASRAAQSFDAWLDEANA
jgi:methylenetetrahydrofolate--tRNA-(uracil-5-)-methyltransferase